MGQQRRATVGLEHDLHGYASLTLFNTEAGSREGLEGARLCPQGERESPSIGPFPAPPILLPVPHHGKCGADNRTSQVWLATKVLGPLGLSWLGCDSQLAGLWSGVIEIRIRDGLM